MSEWAIYDKDGNVRHKSITEYDSNGEEVYSDSLEYTGSWMAECSLTVSIKSAYPIDFHIGDYIMYRGEKFVLANDPSVIKKSSRGSYAEGFTYDSIKFCSHHTELTDIMFLDYVLDDNELHYTSLPVFPFYAANVDDYCDRMQANTNRWCEENNYALTDYWLFVTPNKTRFINRAGRLRKNGNNWEGLTVAQATAIWDEAYGNGTSLDEEKFDVSVSINNENIWNSLSRIKNDFGLNFINRGRRVIVGSAGLPTNHIFEYGKGNGLYEMERQADTEQQVITKLYAYGTEKNMPVRYYSNISKKCYGIVTSVALENNPNYYRLTLDLVWSNNYFANPERSPFDDFYFADCYAYVKDKTTNSAVRFHNLQNGYISGAIYIDNPAVGDVVYITGGIVKDKWPRDHVEYTASQLPNNMAVGKLMLPGFPNQSLYDWVKENGGTDCVDETGQATWRGYTAIFSKERYRPYIMSLNNAELGVKEYSKTFDGSDDTEEICPTIKDTGYDIISHAEVVNDNGIFDDGDDTPTVTLKIGNIGYLKDLIEEGTQEGGDPTIAMTDGFCGGREFKILSASKDGNYWNVKCEREYDDLIQLYFPYSDRASHGQQAIANECYQVRGSDIEGYDGDHFVITGIPMPDTYILQAAIKLLENSLEYLSKNDYTRYTYLPKVDELFMSRQHEDYENGLSGRSLYLTIKEGDLLRFEDSDLRIADSLVFIDSLNIKENGNNGIPTYEITLRNDKTVGSIQRIQNQIDSLSSKGIAGGYSINQLNSLFEGTGARFFLSKLKPDVAQGLIRFAVGLAIGIDENFGFDEFGNGSLNNLNLSGDASISGEMSAASVLASIFRTPEFMQAAGMIGHGFGIDIDNEYRSTLQTDNLLVLGKMIINSLNIREVTYIGGVYLLTPAGSTVFTVQPLYTTAQDTADTRHWTTEGEGTVVGYRLLWLADNGTTATMNYWHQGDQAFCQTFNITEPGEYENVSNTLYWRLVCRVGQWDSDDNKTYHYADVANVQTVNLYDKDGVGIKNTQGNYTFLGYKNHGGSEPTGSVPSSGDKVVCLGSQADRTRQAAIQLTAEGIGSFGIYDEIDGYQDLTTREVHFLSKDRVTMTASKFRWRTAGGDTSAPTVYRGNWDIGKVSAWGDEWTYNGSNWICVLETGTTTEAPNTTSGKWVQNKGDKGDNGKTIKTVQVFKFNDGQPATPTGSTIPPTGWSLAPKDYQTQMDIANGTDPNYTEWREFKGEGEADKFIRERLIIHVDDSADGETWEIDIEASTEENYDFLAIGELDTPLLTRADAENLSNDRKVSGVDQKTVETTLSKGVHFIDVVFSKDDMDSSNQDMAWYYVYDVEGMKMHIDGYAVWSSIATFEDNVLQGSWSTPAQWNGTDGLNGADGEDAFTIIAKPNPIILNQKTSPTTAGAETSDFGLPLVINFSAKCGDNDATVGTPTNVNNNVGLETAASSGKITINRIRMVDGAFRTRGTITCNIPLTYGSRSVSMPFAISVGVNLMGEFKTTIEGDVEKSVGSKLGYAIDPTGHITTIEAAGTFIRSSEEHTTRLEKTVSSKNLLPSSGFTNVQGVATTNWNEEGQYATGAAWSPLIMLEAGIYCVSCYTASTGTVNLSYKKLAVSGNKRPTKPNDIATTSTKAMTNISSETYQGATRRKCYLEFSEKTYLFIAVSGTSAYTKYHPMIERVNANTDGPTEWEIGANYYTSLISQTADNIELKVKNCGINIDEQSVTVKGGKFKMQDNSGNDTFVLGTDGNLETAGNAYIGGTIKAKNFFRNVCYYGQGGIYESESWKYYCYSIQDISGFEKGKYYDPEDVPISYINGHFYPCTYDAEIVYMIPGSSNWNTQDFGDKRVFLPDPKDFEGKQVEVYSFNSESNQSPEIWVGCVKSDSFAILIYFNESNKITRNAVTGHESAVPFAAGDSVKFVSIKASDDKYYWLQLE